MEADSFGLNISSPNDRDSDLEADGEWEDVVPKSEKMEEHFAYVQAATSLQHVRQHLTSQFESLFFKYLAIRHTVGSCDKHHVHPEDEEVSEILFRLLDLSLEGSNLFTVQEMATWFICASTSLNALGTNKKRNFNSPKHWKIRGLEILYPKPTSRYVNRFRNMWLITKNRSNATLFLGKWSLEHGIRLRPDSRRHSR
ncbi:unnamed protein product [Fusarium fujikuroi]|uniref:Uncharacterized protein n=1 Tax=Fusarium fujikuroi TaxID=5127 RepID=A0A9Q9U5Q1_FUSFU|nr:unnamed protein product [Fusarium fujikuroi]VZH99862.1 unnamed protein product [Fusarium fujikuroi]